jgi:RNase P subunit RPR2
MPNIPKYSIIDGHKGCTKCDVIKPVAEFSINNKSKTGVSSQCKQCATVHRVKMRRAAGMPPNTWKAYPVIDGVKKCYKCLKDFSIDQFTYKSKYLRHCCKECDLGTTEERRVKYEARYAKEKEIRSTRIKERRRDPEHMEKFRAWNKASNKKTHESGKWAEWYRKQSELLTDTYLLSVMNQRSSKKKNVYIPKADVSQEVFELLRTKIKLQRELRQLNSLNQ